MVKAITDTTKGDPKKPEMRALQFEISRDKQMETLEKKSRDIFGPLSALLDLTVKAEKGEQVDWTMFADLTDKAVVLANQLRNNIIYQRQRAIIGAMKLSDSKAKVEIKLHQKILNKGNKKGDLFGSKYKKRV